MPIKMLYESTTTQAPEEVDVYDFHFVNDSGYQIYVTGWLVRKNHWVTAPLELFKPISSTKVSLNETIQ